MFKKGTLHRLFKPPGLVLQDYAISKCVCQATVDAAVMNITAGPAKDPDHLGTGVIAGLAVIGALLALMLLLLAWGLLVQCCTRSGASGKLASGKLVHANCCNGMG
jgi:hypothetical protein